MKDECLIIELTNNYSFCESYPQYLKYFTLDPNIPLNFHARTMTKITAIIEALGYLMLDFHNKPKKLDRLVGYLAMVHKDMRLEKQDIRVSLYFFIIISYKLSYISRITFAIEFLIVFGEIFIIKCPIAYE